MWVTNGAQATYRLFAKDVDHPDYGTKKHGGTTAFIVDADYEGLFGWQKGRQTRHSLFRYAARWCSTLQGAE